MGLIRNGDAFPELSQIASRVHSSGRAISLNEDSAPKVVLAFAAPIEYLRLKEILSDYSSHPRSPEFVDDAILALWQSDAVNVMLQRLALISSNPSWRESGQIVFPPSTPRLFCSKEARTQSN